MNFLKSGVFKFIIVIVILITALFLYSKYLGPTGLEVREYRVDSDVLTSNFSGLKVVHFSDLLYGSTVDIDDVKNIVKRINILKPDIVLFTGDLISNNYKFSINDKDKLIKFIQNIQYNSPVDSNVTAIPWSMPGYKDEVIMAAGCFVQGASIELSADAPIRPPYIAYFQGGLTYEHCKIVLKNLDL
jgi:cystathionine beta-lyase family protein involved in aluminum resistance